MTRKLIYIRKEESVNVNQNKKKLGASTATLNLEVIQACIFEICYLITARNYFAPSEKGNCYTE